MATNVFVASTPLQLISCTEAKAHYRCPDSSCLLIVARPDNRITEVQMTYLLDKLGWAGLEVLYLKKSTFYLRLSSVFRGLSRRQIEHLFIGNQCSWIHEAFYRGLPWKRLVFVDDGLATVKYYHLIHRQGLSSRITTVKRRLLSGLGVRLRRDVTERFEFFTFLPLESSKKVEVEYHDFGAFRRACGYLYKGDRGSAAIGFLGQPFIGDEWQAQLREQLKMVIRQNPGEKIIYFMHRKERLNILLRTFEGLSVEVRKPNLPIEIEVARSATNFTGFYSFTSTALLTLKKMFPDMDVFQINDDIMSQDFPFYKEILEVFKKAEIKTLHL